MKLGKMLIMKGNKIMQILKIENNQAKFSLDGVNFTSIDKITKESILSLINIVLDKDEIEMDEYNETLPCQQSSSNYLSECIWKTM